mgnify:CR=1 FL=1
MDELQQKIVDYVEANGKTYQQIALEIHEKPEVSNYEFFASKRLADQIKSVGFEVEMPAAGHRTGFAASYKSGKPGPVMVFLAEYDALVGLGHGCGHNLFGATSSLAERSASTAHLERKAEKTEVRREALSARDISRTLTRLFPHIRVWDIALQKKHLDVFRSILNSGVRRLMRLRHRSRESML